MTFSSPERHTTRLLALALALAGSSAIAQSGPAEPAPINPVTDAYPTVSPDGKRMIFQSKRLGRGALFISNADGSDLRVFLDADDEPAGAVWSPDGRRVAYAGTVDGDSEIFVVDADGRNRRRLTNIKADDSHPYWSPDGTRIYFSSGRDTPDPSLPFGRQWHDIFSIRADGSDVRKHTNCRTVCTYPAPSPDGRRIAYRKILPTPGMRWDLSVMPLDSEVFVSNLDGTGEKNLSNSSAYDGWPAWSPDGRWIAFTSNRAGPASTGQVFIVSPDGGEPKQVTAGRWSNTTPRWSPDSSKIYTYRHMDFVQYEIGSIGVAEVPAD